MGNGLIFAFVVALWAAYFVPLAVRRHEEAAKSGSIEKLSSLSRVIKAKVQRDDSAEADEPGPTVAVEAPVGAPAGAPVGTTGAATPVDAPQPTRASQRVAARRRRRTLLTLIFAAVVVGTLTAFSLIGLWSPAIPLALIVAWLIACRVQVRSELGLARRKFSLPRRRAAFVAADEEEHTVILSGQFEDIHPHRQHVMEKDVLSADALDEQLVIAVPVVSTQGDALWDPLPVTLPTYVTKPRAGRTVRTIEFGEPGAWTSGHVEGEDVELPKRSDAADDGEHRHAVGH